MKNKMRVLGLVALAAALVGAHVAWSQTMKKSLKVTVTLPPPPTACSLSCSPGNLRSTGGVLSLSWSSNGTAVNVSGSHGGGGNFGPSGSTTINTGGGWGYRTYTAVCSNDGGSISASCSSILSCFTKGTKILMEDGTYKNIEDVQVGDRVMSWDTEKGEFVGSSVVKTIQTTSDKYYVVNGSLKITPTHPLYVNGEWKMSNEMKKGDFLLNANGERVEITSLEEVVGDVDVYNLNTDYPNDFFAENFLVHNDSEGDSHQDRGLTAGTRISMIDGRMLEVEKVRTGDRILSYDPKGRRYVVNTIRKTSSQRVGKTLKINGKLRVGTKHQVFFVPQPKKGKAKK